MDDLVLKIVFVACLAFAVWVVYYLLYMTLFAVLRTDRNRRQKAVRDAAEELGRSLAERQNTPPGTIPAAVTPQMFVQEYMSQQLPPTHLERCEQLLLGLRSDMNSFIPVSFRYVDFDYAVLELRRFETRIHEIGQLLQQNTADALENFVRAGGTTPNLANARLAERLTNDLVGLSMRLNMARHQLELHGRRPQVEERQRLHELPPLQPAPTPPARPAATTQRRVLDLDE